MTDPVLLEQIIKDYYRKHHQPLRAIRNLTAALIRNGKMSKFQLNWDDPTITVGGKPGTTASVDLFQDPDDITPIGNVKGGVQTFTTGDLTPGSYSYMAVAIDPNGVRSAPSNIATGTIPAAGPDPLVAISNLTVTVVP